MDLKWKGVTYLPGVVIPEELYEDWIDRAYGTGRNLKDTTLWKRTYQYGFIAPDGDGGWFAFANDGRRCLYLGSFDDRIIPDEEDWEDYRTEKLMEADVSKPREAIWILRNLYLDQNSKDEWTEKGLRIASDKECLDWFVDYWTFVRWNERGNQCSVLEIGFTGFIDTILDPGQVSEYLLDAGCDRAVDLDTRLSVLARRYAGGRKR